MSTDAQKRARSEVALTGLKYLLTLEDSEAVARRNLFVPNTSNKLQIEQALRKPWQTQFIERLVDEGILNRIENAGQIAYLVGNRPKLRDIVQDFKQGGLKLSSYLWPGSVVVPAAAPNLEVNEATGEVTSAELLLRPPGRTRTTLLAGSSEDPDVPKLATSVDDDDEKLKELNQLFNELLKSQHQNAKVISDVINLLGENIATVRKSIVIAGEAIDALNEKFEGFEKRLDPKFGSINRRLDDLDKRLLDAHKLSEASHVIVKSFTSDTETLKHVRTELESSAGQIRESVAEAVALRQSVNALLAQIKRGEQDQLGKLLKKLEANASESLALKDLIVGNIAEATSNG